MAIKITLKNSVVQDSVPTTSHLAAVGELALNANINSLGIYMRASDNSIVKMAGPGSLTTPAASTTAAGIAELATSAETTTGTDTARVTTPAGVKAVTDAERTTSNNTYLAKAGGTLTGVLAATAGSNSAPAIHFGDTDSGIYGGTNTVSLAAGGTQGLTLSSAGKVSCPVGIDVGGASSSYNFSVKLATDKHIGFSPNQGELGSVPALVAYDDAGGLEDIGFRGTTVRFARSSAEVARFDSSGRLLVAHSSGTAPGAFSSKISIEDVDSAASFSVTRNSANNGGPVILLGKTRTATVGGTTIVQSGDGLGELRFYGADGTDRNSQAAQIKAEVDGTPGENDMPGRLVFSTTADGASTVTTRLTIDSAGLVNVPDNGKFTAGASDDLQIYHDGTHSYLKNTGGNIVLQGNDVNSIVLQSVVGENALICNANTNVELYHDGSKKFETTSLGVAITGSNTSSNACTVTGGNFRISGDDEYLLKLRHTSASYDGNFSQTSDGDLRYQYGSTEIIRFTTDGHVQLDNDQGKLQLGASQDLQIYHDGSNSYLSHSGAGDLFIDADGSQENINLRSKKNVNIYVEDKTELAIKCKESAAVELYYDNSLKFDTQSDGVKFYGHLYTNDANKIQLGNSQDLQIYHDGTNNYLVGSPPLFIRSNNLLIQNGAGTEGYISAIENGGVELYYDNSKKLETNAGGVKVFDYLRFTDSGKIMLGASDDFSLFHNGSNSYIDNSTGLLYLRGADTYISNADGTETIARFSSNGPVELYHDNVKKFETSSAGVVITGVTASDPSAIIYHSDADVIGEAIRFGRTDLKTIRYHSIKAEHSGAAVSNMLQFHIHNATGSPHTSQLEVLELTGDGRVHVNDDVKFECGTGGDLQIYHGSDVSMINETSGNLYLQSDLIHFRDWTNGEYYAKMTRDGAVELYYNNSKKFYTYTSGAIVSGALLAGRDAGSEGAGASVGCEVNGSNKYGMFVRHSATTMYLGRNTNNGTILQFLDDGSSVGSVSTNGNSLPSDRNYKKNISNLTLGLNLIDKLNPISYNYKFAKDGDPLMYGLIAQDLETSLEEVGVSKNSAAILQYTEETENDPIINNDQSKYNLSYEKLIPILINAVKELSTKVAALEGA